MASAIAYKEGFDLKTTEPLRVEVLALRGGPVTLTASMLAVAQSIHLTAAEARTLAQLLAHASIAARKEEG